MEMFKEAILISLAPTETSKDVEVQALEYLRQVEESEDGWLDCTRLLVSDEAPDQDDVQFAILKVLVESAKHGYSQASFDQQQELRDFLLGYCESIQDTSAQTLPSPIFIRNKVAQLFAIVLLQDFPVSWPSFFDDIAQLISIGSIGVDLYVRILDAVDAAVANRELNREAQDHERNSTVRDAMRESAVESILQNAAMIIDSDETKVDLKANCLVVISHYLYWVDLGLTVASKLPEIACRIIAEQLLEEEYVDVIDGASQLLQQLILKGMPAQDKLGLIEALPLYSAFRVLVEGPAPDQDSDDTLAHIDNLAAATKLCSVVMTAMAEATCSGFSDGEDVTEWLEKMQEMFAVCIWFLSYHSNTVSEHSISGIASCIQSVLKCLNTAGDDQDTSTLVQFVRWVLEETVPHALNKLRLTLDHDGWTLLMESELESDVGEQSFRTLIRNLISNLCNVDSDFTLNQLAEYGLSLLGQALDVLRGDDGTLDASLDVAHSEESLWPNVECAMHSAYLLLELSKPPQFIAASDQDGVTPVLTPLGQLMEACYDLLLHSTSHVSVVSAYIELAGRSARFFACQPQHLEQVLSVFVSEVVLGNDHPTVRSRGAYILGMTILRDKHIQPLAAPFVSNIVQMLLPFVSPNLAEDDNSLPCTAQLNLFEGFSWLMGHRTVDAQIAYSTLDSFTEPLLQQLDTTLASALAARFPAERDAFAEQLVHIIHAVTRLSKGFAALHSKEDTAQLAEHFEHIASKISQVFSMQANQDINAALRTFLHRMIIVLGPRLLPHISTFLSGFLAQLQETMQQDGIEPFVSLISHILSKYKTNATEIIDELVTPFTQVTFRLLERLESESGADSQIESRVAVSAASSGQCLVRESLCQFYHTILKGPTKQVLVSDTNQPVFYDIVQFLLSGVTDFIYHGGVARFSMTNLYLIVSWLLGTVDEPSGFSEYVFDQLLPTCMFAPLNARFNLDDADYYNFLGQLASLEIFVVQSNSSDSAVTAMSSSILPQMNCSDDMVQEYLSSLSEACEQASKVKKQKFFQRFLKTVYEALQQTESD
eukprot:m.172516 g.172516  ORF g.172516 m.172516 type:complete len:1053 (-) comp14580_c0_seq7:1623-4781(-)